MKIKAASDTDYTVEFSGIKAEFFLKGESQGVFEMRTILHVRKTLGDWARLKTPISSVLEFQRVAEKYVGCTVDDIQYSSDGKSFLINGKPLEVI